MGVYQRDGRFMVYWFENGKRRDKSFGRGEFAQQHAEAFEQSVKGVAPVEDQPVQDVSDLVPQTGMTFEKLSKMHLEHLRASGKTERHIKNVSVLLENCFIPLIGKETLVDAMTYPDHILPLITQFQSMSPQTGKPRSQATVNRYGDYIDAIFNFGIQSGLTTTNPMKMRKRCKEKPREVQLTIEDMKRIMSFAEPHVRWAIEVCFNLGTRPGTSELLSLRWNQVDFSKGIVRIYASKTKTYRVVPVKPSFLEKLKTMKEQALSEYVIEYRGKKVTTIRKSFTASCKLAGIEYPVRMYDLRHLFATTMLTNNADLAAVSKLMGHSTVKMTADTYYHYMEGEKERAIHLLPEVVLA